MHNWSKWRQIRLFKVLYLLSHLINKMIITLKTFHAVGKWTEGFAVELVCGSAAREYTCLSSHGSALWLSLHCALCISFKAVSSDLVSRRKQGHPSPTARNSETLPEWMKEHMHNCKHTRTFTRPWVSVFDTNVIGMPGQINMCTVEGEVNTAVPSACFGPETYLQLLCRFLHAKMGKVALVIIRTNKVKKRIMQVCLNFLDPS